MKKMYNSQNTFWYLIIRQLLPFHNVHFFFFFLLGFLVFVWCRCCSSLASNLTEPYRSLLKTFSTFTFITYQFRMYIYYFVDANKILQNIINNLFSIFWLTIISLVFSFFCMKLKKIYVIHFYIHFTVLPV